MERVERLLVVLYVNMRDVIFWLDKGLYKLVLIKLYIVF